MLSAGLFDSVEDWKRQKRVVARKINVILFFDIEFFGYFFRVLHEAGSSWLQFGHAFQ
jgi:hypothetical protein